MIFRALTKLLRLLTNYTLRQSWILSSHLIGVIIAPLIPLLHTGLVYIILMLPYWPTIAFIPSLILFGLPIYYATPKQLEKLPRRPLLSYAEMRADFDLSLPGWLRRCHLNYDPWDKISEAYDEYEAAVERGIQEGDILRYRKHFWDVVLYTRADRRTWEKTSWTIISALRGLVHGHVILVFELIFELARFYPFMASNLTFIAAALITYLQLDYITLVRMLLLPNFLVAIYTTPKWLRNISIFGELNSPLLDTYLTYHFDPYIAGWLLTTTPEENLREAKANPRDFIWEVQFGEAHEPVEYIKNPRTGEIMHSNARVVFIEKLFKSYAVDLVAWSNWLFTKKNLIRRQRLGTRH